MKVGFRMAPASVFPGLAESVEFEMPHVPRVGERVKMVSLSKVDLHVVAGEWTIHAVRQTCFATVLLSSEPPHIANRPTRRKAHAG